MQYGSETLHVPYLPITGRVSLDVETTNNVVWGSIGPQIQVPVGPVQPYMNAAIGFMDFRTSTSVSGSDSDYEYARSTNSDDATSAWIFGGGLYVPLGTSEVVEASCGRAGTSTAERRPISREGDIIDNPDGSVTLFTETEQDGSGDVAGWSFVHVSAIASAWQDVVRFPLTSSPGSTMLALLTAIVFAQSINQHRHRQQAEV